MRRLLLAVCALAALGAGIAVAQVGGGKEEGRIGPANRIQPSGRLLNPAGRMSEPLGNFPAGGALTTNGRFLWTLSAGRGNNDIRIVEVEPKVRCRKGRRGRACRRARLRRVGRVVQTIPMPGVNGGIAMSPDNRTAYVSGTPESTHRDQLVPDDVPGQGGDVIHVFRYDGVTGQARRDGVIPVPAPADSPTVQTFPPAPTGAKQSWPRDIGISRDGKRILVALNLADHAAVIDTDTRRVRYVRVGSYPYGAAILRDGKHGLVSNESDGTVSVIDLERATKVKDIQVGPHLSHPEGIAADPKADRAYVAVTHEDLVRVIDTRRMEVERSLSVGRPEGIGTAPTHVSLSRGGRRLFVTNSGSDEVAVFAIPQADPEPTVTAKKKRKARRRSRRRSRRGRRSALAARAEAVLRHEGRRGADLSENTEEEAAERLGEEAEERAEAAKKRRPVTRVPADFELIGRIPVGSYPVMAESTPRRSGRGPRLKMVWLSGKGLGVGANPRGPNPLSRDDTDDAQSRFQYLPREVRGVAGILRFPTDAQLRAYTPKASRQIRPVNGQKPPPGTPIAEPGQPGGGRIKHVFYVVRENRTYDQVLGDDPRGDGDPLLTLFPESVTPNAHALARRFPLLDHVYANSEASIDGHFWTSAAAVSDYVVKNWQQNYAARKRPYDFGVYAVTWPSQRFLFDQAEKQGISYFNYGEAIAGVVPFPDKDRNQQETEEVARKLAKSDLGPPQGCFPNDASSGGVDVVLDAAAGRVRQIEVFDSSKPEGAPPDAESRFDCLRARFEAQLRTNSVPAFNYITFANDHTAGTTPGRRTPRAMVAENDYALGQLVDLVSHSPIWKQSVILVIEDDSQNGADHVDAHRIPAFAISPYAKRGAVVHTRYDFLSFIRTLEIVLGMDSLNLFDELAVPLYDAFSPEPANDEPYDAIVPEQSLIERNPPNAPGARMSKALRIGDPGNTDLTPQRLLDEVLWKSVHGADAEPPPPGPNASPIDEAAAQRAERRMRAGLPAHPQAEAEEEEEEEE